MENTTSKLKKVNNENQWELLNISGKKWVFKKKDPSITEMMKNMKQPNYGVLRRRISRKRNSSSKVVVNQIDESK